jgi:mersacidin/lichenicidin family type 2 lantibiotic
MSTVDVIRAWKDREYRQGLSQAQQDALPSHPAGFIELPESELSHVAGGATQQLATIGCCHGFTTDWAACAASLAAGTTCVFIRLP